jgi:hypothetical protein
MADEKSPHLKSSDRFRESSENCRQLAEHATSEPLAKRYLRMTDAWMALAEEQDWLEGESDPPGKV